ADINSEDFTGSVLQQTVAKATGRGADIQSDNPRDIEVKGAKRGLKFVPTTAYITGTGLIFDTQRSGYTDQCARLVHPLFIHYHRASHDQPPGLLAALGQATLG